MVTAGLSTLRRAGSEYAAYAPVMRPKLTIALLIGLSFLPYLLLAPYSVLSGAPVQLAADLLGLLGAQILWWQFMLGIRGIVSRLTADLLAVNSVHRTLGTYGFLLIVAHPIAMTVAYTASLPTLFGLDYSQPFRRWVALGQIAFTILAMVWLSSALLRGRMAWRRWKTLHYAVYAAFPLVAVHSLQVGRVLELSPTLRWYWLTLIALWCAAVVWRLARWLGAGWHRYEVAANTPLTHDVTEVRLRPRGKAMSPRPGQFAYLRVGRRSRPFTIAGHDPSSGEITMTVKTVGPFSAEVRSLPVGAGVRVSGPYGVFTRHLSGRAVVMVAGGIGITPFLHRAGDVDSGDQLFWANKTPADVSHTVEVRAVDVFSAAGDDPGYITTELLERELSENLDTYDWLLCGPPLMLASVERQLAAAGVPPSQMYTERFSL